MRGRAPNAPKILNGKRKNGGIFHAVCLVPQLQHLQKAKAFLDSRGAAYTARDIKADRPAEAELRAWQAAGGLPLKKLFNTSGQLYKTLALKDKLPAMGEDEQFALLAGDGMLVKRPILVLDDGRVLVGFKEAEWAAALGQ